MNDSNFRNESQGFEEIPGELPADRASRYARWRKAQDLRTESERIAARQGLDPDAHLTRRELRAKKRATRQRRRWQGTRANIPIIEQNQGRIVKVEIIKRGA